jgi:ABC-2 type transport system permease protein
MAELSMSEMRGDLRLAALPHIPARVQLLAIAWLRWRMFVNTFFRRRANARQQAAGIVLAILLRIIVWPMLAMMVVGPVVFSGYLAWESISDYRPGSLTPLLAGVLIFWQFISINGMSLATTTQSFDPTTLTRYPIPFGRYLVLRTIIGLLTASTIVGCLASAAVAVGIGIARHSLLVPALMVMAVYAVMNIFLTRMLGAWLERWLAIRRFREIFSVMMAASFLSIQIMIPSRGSLHMHGAMMPWYLRVAQSSAATMSWLPPGLAAHAIVRSQHWVTASLQLAAVAAYAALFLAIFAVRLRKQYLGEYLVDIVPGANKPATQRVAKPSRKPAAPQAITQAGEGRSFISPAIAACMRKEYMVVRANTGMLVSMFTPLFFVFILSRGNFARHAEYFLPSAIGYVLLGLVASFYNIFGADGMGVQFYLMAPIKLRDVIVAKNIVQVSMITVQATLAWILVLLFSQRAIPLLVQLAAGLWLVFFIAANLALGTLRSIQAPRRFVPGQSRQLRQTTPANRTSSLLVMAVLLGGLIFQVPVTFLARYFHLPWLGVAVFSVLAATAVGLYVLLLHSADVLILKYRDRLTEELCKTG